MSDLLKPADPFAEYSYNEFRDTLLRAEVWLHKFNATFATRALWAGVDLRTVQEWREYELEEPVALVVEKYATFIDSTPDHVVNSALKIVLWRDRLLFAKTPARRGINKIAAAISTPFCYKS